MKGQDLVVALCLTRPRPDDWTYESLRDAAGLSASAAHAAVERLRVAELVEEGGWRVRREHLVEFLAHGLRYAFAVRPGPEAIGVPTASALPAVRNALRVREALPLVWPHPGGGARGSSLEALYQTVPRVALRDRELHELLALTDCVRVGSARERGGAITVLSERLRP